jgi:hypothetical protein
VLERPRLVFLFGCNSLAGKRPDHRSPAQYRDILVRDGLDPDRADRAVALRYFPLGDATRARIQKVFSRGALVFGFSSTSPLGQEAGPYFARYLRDASRPIAKTLQSRTVDRASRDALVRPWMEVFRGMNPAIVEGGPALTLNECRFRDPEVPRLQRLLSAEQLLAGAPVENALLIHDFLREHSDWNEDETAVLTRMTHDEAARREVLETLGHLPDSRNVYFSMLRLARALDWMDEAEFERRQRQRLNAMLIDGATGEEVDFLCSHDLSYVPPADVLARNRGSLNFVRALPCLDARSEAVRRFLLARLSDGSRETRVAVLDALRELRLLVPADVGRLRGMYRVSSGELKESLLWALAASDGPNVDVQRLIAVAALDPDTDVAWTSAQILKQLRPPDTEALQTLAAALGREDGFVRRGVALALEALHPHDARVLESLRPFLEDPDPVVRGSVRGLLAHDLAAMDIN